MLSIASLKQANSVAVLGFGAMPSPFERHSTLAVVAVVNCSRPAICFMATAI